jgi:hypothetical protein
VRETESASFSLSVCVRALVEVVAHALYRLLSAWLTAAGGRMVRTGPGARVTQEAFLEVERKVLLATSEPLCLDPSVNVALISNGAGVRGGGGARSEGL